MRYGEWIFRGRTSGEGNVPLNHVTFRRPQLGKHRGIWALVILSPERDLASRTANEEGGSSSRSKGRIKTRCIVIRPIALQVFKSHPDCSWSSSFATSLLLHLRASKRPQHEDPLFAPKSLGQRRGNALQSRRFRRRKVLARQRSSRLKESDDRSTVLIQAIQESQRVVQWLFRQGRPCYTFIRKPSTMWRTMILTATTCFLAGESPSPYFFSLANASWTGLGLGTSYTHWIVDHDTLWRSPTPPHAISTSLAYYGILSGGSPRLAWFWVATCLIAIASIGGRCAVGLRELRREGGVNTGGYLFDAACTCE